MSTFVGIGLGPIQTGIFLAGAAKGGFDRIVIAEVNEKLKAAVNACHSVTVTADILKMLISHPMTDAAVSGFDKDWKSVYGEKTILDF